MIIHCTGPAASFPTTDYRLAVLTLYLILYYLKDAPCIWILLADLNSQVSSGCDLFLVLVLGPENGCASHA